MSRRSSSSAPPGGAAGSEPDGGAVGVIPRSALVRLAMPVLAAVLFSLIGVALVRTAWISDDAMISFRTVLNVSHGYGLTWNIDERVQAFTHPLWLGLLTVAYRLTGELFLTTIWLSIGLTLLAVVVLCLQAPRSADGLVPALTCLLCSKAFIDYGTSGLENPLTNLLLALLVLLVERQPERRGPALAGIALACGLLLSNRLDLVLVVAPLLALAVRRARLRPRSTFFWLLLGALPFLGWIVFAFLYYGGPLPNTYYAKLAAGMPVGDYLLRGARYYLDLLQRDPLSAVAIALGLLGALISRAPLTKALAIGIGLHLGYALYIGGDFMAYRLFALPVFLAAILVSRLRWRPPLMPLATAFVLFAGSFLAASPLLSGRDYHDSLISPWGIADERGFYYQRFGLLAPNRAFPPLPDWGELDRNQNYYVEVSYTIGANGLRAPALHLVDTLGLADPLLARLPAFYKPSWRVGHLRRHVPTGYLETLEFGYDHFVDREIARLYGQIEILTRGEIFSRRRLRTIVRWNLGMGRPAIDRARYRGTSPAIPLRLPPDRPIAYERVSAERKPDGRRWDYPGNWVIEREREVVFAQVQKGFTRLEASLDHNDTYLTRFMKGTRQVGEIRIGPVTGWGLSNYRLRIPRAARRRGFDRILIEPVEGDGLYALGHLVLTRRAGG